MSLGSQLNQQVPEPVLRHRQQRRAGASPTVSRGPSCCGRTRSSPTSFRSTRRARSRATTRCRSPCSKRLSRRVHVRGVVHLGEGRSEIGMNHQDSYDIDASRALASYDITHRFVLSYLYELPVGRGRRFGADRADVALNAIIGGWQFNGITTFQAARRCRSPPTTRGTSSTRRPRRTATAQSRDSTARVEDRLRALFRHDRLQPAGRVHVRQRADVSPMLRTRRRAQLRSLALQELHTLGGRMRLQFRVEALNAFNRVQFCGRTPA